MEKKPIKQILLNKQSIILFLIFLCVFIIRIYFSFQAPYFSDEESYFHLRQIESIIESGKPVFYDNLSFGGRQLVFSPLYHYIIALFGLAFPLLFIVKILPALFMSLGVFCIYLISKEITKNTQASLFAAFISGFIPILFKSTLNTLSPFTLIVPFFLLMIYCFLKINKEYYIYLFVMLTIIFTILSSVSFIFVGTLLIYLLLLKLENLKVKREELEIILFSTFLVIWLQFIIYKKAFLFHGLDLIWRNIPLAILSEYFTKTTVAEALYLIGIIPFIFGIYIMYENIFKNPDKKLHLLFAFAIIFSILLWLRLIEPQKGLTFLGIMLVLLFSTFYCKFFKFLEDTKFANHKNIFIFVFLAVFIISSIIPSVDIANKTIDSSVTKDEIKALTWISENTKANDVILATIYYGHLINSISKRQNVIDSNFILVDDANKRYAQTKEIYLTVFLTEAIENLEKYKINYIILTPRIKEELNINALKYTNNDCFDLVYNKTVQIYKTKCTLRQV